MVLKLQGGRGRSLAANGALVGAYAGLNSLAARWARPVTLTVIDSADGRRARVYLSRASGAFLCDAGWIG